MLDGALVSSLGMSALFEKRSGAGRTWIRSVRKGENEHFGNGTIVPLQRPPKRLDEQWE